eukprot:g1701.t1
MLSACATRIPAPRAALTRALGTLQATATGLDQPFPGVPDSTPVAASGSVEVQSSTLENGVRVVSADMGGAAVASVRLLANAGSRYETDATEGASQLLAHAAFKGTSSRSAVRFAMDIEDLGGDFGASANREHLVYSADVLKGNADAAVAMLAETALDAKFTPWGLDAVRHASFEAEMGDVLSSPSVLLSENLHAAAFRDNSGLGRPCFSLAEGVDAAALGAFSAAATQGGNLVLAGAGVGHAELVAAAEAALGGAEAGGGGAAAPVAFVGGESRTRARSTGGETYLSLGFEGAGAGNAKDAAASSVLAVVLGLADFTTFNASYAETGLFGFTCATDEPGAALSAMVAALQGAAKGVDAAVLKRAQMSVVGSIGGGDGSKRGTASELARRAAYGVGGSSAETAAAVTAVTAADVSGAAQKALASKPALASLGNMTGMPYLDEVVAQLK